MEEQRKKDSVFRFKQFSVNQQGSAMKINTDGVLLAAGVPQRPAENILDIGAGTGVIALMLAQRFPEAQVDALEINPQAATCARTNFAHSPFSGRLKLHKVDVKDFQPERFYDLIISNPPFFIDALPSETAEKTLARHAGQEFFRNLFDRSYEWASPEGSFQLILPEAVYRRLKMEGYLGSWQLESEMRIRSFPSSPVIRVVLNLVKKQRAGVKHTLREFVIYERKGVYSAAYKELLSPYFLNF